MIKLIQRNVSVYFRDKVSVFFSLLGVLIVVLVYVLFLAQLQLDEVIQRLDYSMNKDKLSFLINSWTLGGMLTITTLTSTLGALGFIVDDRENKIIKDFKSSPLSIMAYPVASVISSIIVGVIISLLGFIVYGLYIFIGTGYYFDLITIIKSIGLIIISSTMNASLMGFLVSFFSTNRAFSSASVIAGTSIGFLVGLYIPIGQLSEKLQTVLKILPFSHIAALFRQVLTKEPLNLVFKNAPQAAINEYTETFGIILKWNNGRISFNTSIVFILIVFIFSLVLFFINFRRKDQSI